MLQDMTDATMRKQVLKKSGTLVKVAQNYSVFYELSPPWLLLLFYHIFVIDNAIIKIFMNYLKRASVVTVVSEAHCTQTLYTRKFQN